MCVWGGEGKPSVFEVVVEKFAISLSTQGRTDGGWNGGGIEWRAIGSSIE